MASSLGASSQKSFSKKPHTTRFIIINQLCLPKGIPGVNLTHWSILCQCSISIHPENVRERLDNFELLRANTWSLLINIIWQENSIWRVLIWGYDKTSGCFDKKTLSLIFPSSYSVPKINNKPSQQLSTQN